MYGVFTMLGAPSAGRGLQARSSAATAILRRYDRRHDTGACRNICRGLLERTYKNLIAYTISAVVPVHQAHGIFNERAIQDV
jgi:hypothetical protein